MPEGSAIPTILQRILTTKRGEVSERQVATPLERLREALPDAPPARDFRGALATDGLSLIAEFKRASPSKGVIREGAEPAGVARLYEAAGARAMSVLTDGPYFQGSDDDLRAARGAVSLPVLRKDFAISEYQIAEARALGADAVLLIVAALSDAELAGLMEAAAGLGLAALVETHTAGEVDRAVALGAEIIGINNRDLHTFETTLDTTLALRDRVPPGRVVVSESGIFTGKDTARLRDAGVDAILVGESLMRSEDIAANIRDLLHKG